MLRKLAVSAVGAGALALVAGSPAFALTGTWTYSGPTTVTASSSNLIFQAGTLPVTAACTSATATGTRAATSGTWVSTPPSSGGTPVITGLAITTSGCATTNITPQMTFNLTQNGTAQLYVTGVTAGSPSVTPGEIRGLSVKGTALGGLCTVQVDGPGGANSKTGVIGGTYTTNGTTGTITATGASNMTIKSASALCTLGGLAVGDAATLSGSFSVTSAIPTITATSP
ncbi:hypothetical protein EDD29_6134 [Actinocorallia herbida]|uniref:Ig-like domain-containing protein n=1 Tax=Actinocorallia herbida TaxID=58109 RepID=A0A3N1D4L2_9ACTN|nr:hypothetical protein [Actinocorallia herbida]ROO88465.1 hypothetical protein EDD29_6134 [Actinocorallia herbida]